MSLPTVTVSSEVQTDIKRLSRTCADGRETGGILLGRGPGAGGVIRVELAGEPGPNAERTSDFFLRDLDFAKRLAAKAWRESRAVWVGEWHTHLTAGPEPSAKDLQTYLGHLRAEELAFSVFVSIIVVPKKDDWSDVALYPWVLTLPDPEHGPEEPKE
jgi:integrative and conjugative element protein (TIGR02256 family)